MFRSHFYAVVLLPLLLLLLLTVQKPLYAQQATPKATPTKQALKWTPPAEPSIILEAGATITDDVVTYSIYPVNTANHAVWDLHVTVPIPTGATFLAAGAPSPFVSSFDGRTVSFAASELTDQGEAPLLRFQMSVKQVATAAITTTVSASWHYVQTNLGTSMFVEQTAKSGELTIQPHAAQQVVADTTGDVPFANYDLQNVTLEQDQSSLKITLNTAGAIGPVGAGRNEYNVYIDTDCTGNTGRQKGGSGADYRVRYQHDKGLASLNIWDKTATITGTTSATDTNAASGTDTSTDSSKAGGWRVTGSLSAIGPPTDHSITVWVPRALLPIGDQFCWSADTQNRSNDFTPKPPPDQLPETSNKLLITQYNASKPETIDITTPITETVGYTNNGSTRLVRTITPTLALTPPSFTTVKGKIALSWVNEQAGDDVHVLNLPDGEEVTKISNASRPGFKSDGQHLLINRNDGVYEYALAGSREVRVSDALSATYPAYNAQGEAAVYENLALPTTMSASAAPLFKLCDLAASQGDAKAQCRTLPDSQMLAATKLPGELRGTHPLWTANDTVVYQGCAEWLKPAACGLYLLRAKQTGSESLFLRQLTYVESDVPTATRGNVIAFTSQGTGDWEVYVMRLDGAWVKNLSQNSTAQDVLPTLSPDGNWLAFVSNRSGKWAVWVAPLLTGEPRKLFDLPIDKPWGDKDQNWQQQRLSWSE
ncbi:MAG: hypothetical protein U0350_45220 [Caldilineaceae bacterium]